MSSRVRQGNVSSRRVVSSWSGAAEPCRLCSQKTCSRSRWVSALMPAGKREILIVSCSVYTAPSTYYLCATNIVLLEWSFVAEFINKTLSIRCLHEPNCSLQINQCQLMVWAPQVVLSMQSISWKLFHICHLTSLDWPDLFSHNTHRVQTIRPTDAGHSHRDDHGAHGDPGLF